VTTDQGVVKQIKWAFPMSPSRASASLLAVPDLALTACPGAMPSIQETSGSFRTTEANFILSTLTDFA
jgi:hypothetical protein